MSLLLNFGLAWVSMALGLALCMIFVLRLARGRVRDQKTLETLKRWHTGLRKYHKVLGILLILTGLIHGLFSSQSVFTLNIGTLAWVLSITLGLNFMFRKHLSPFKSWLFYHRVLTGLFIGLVVWHIVDVGGIHVHQVIASVFDEKGAIAQVTEVAYPGLTFKDGTYTGTADGYQPGLTVEVVVENQRIASVRVTDHNEVNSRFWARPVEEIPAAIVADQSVDVDAVSGATFTSIGIMNAVRNALSPALVSGTLTETQDLPATRGGHGRGH